MAAKATPTELAPDARLEDCDDAPRVLRDLERFEPCGHQNPAPMLMVDAEVRAVRVLRGNHLRFDLATARGTLPAFGFELGVGAPENGAKVRAFGKLRRDTYRGGDAVELRLEQFVALG